jgi:methionyl-tRNA formyltransferase
MSAGLLARVLDLKAAGRPPEFLEQDEAAATYAEKIGSPDRLLDPERTATELERQVRALEPHIGARVALSDGTLLGVHRAAVVRAPPSAIAPSGEGSPEALAARGRHLRGEGQRLLLDCREGTLELLIVKPPGRRAMDAASYLRGHRSG